VNDLSVTKTALPLVGADDRFAMWAVSDLITASLASFQKQKQKSQNQQQRQHYKEQIR
jgi:hypothetical protein